MKSTKKLRTTEAFKKAVIDFSQRTGMAQYKIATKAEISPSLLSCLLNDTMLFYPDDPRIKRVASVVNFRHECFDKKA
jgi:hypothetical protein